MEDFKYNQLGLAKHMPYNKFLHMASQKKAGMDSLDGVSRVRKIEEHGRKPRIDEDSLQNDTELHRMRVVEQFKRVQEMNKLDQGMLAPLMPITSF